MTYFSILAYSLWILPLAIGNLAFPCSKRTGDSQWQVVLLQVLFSYHCAVFTIQYNWNCYKYANIVCSSSCISEVTLLTITRKRIKVCLAHLSFHPQVKIFSGSACHFLKSILRGRVHTSGTYLKWTALSKSSNNCSVNSLQHRCLTKKQYLIIPNRSSEGKRAAHLEMLIWLQIIKHEPSTAFSPCIKCAQEACTAVALHCERLSSNLKAILLVEQF